MLQLKTNILCPLLTLRFPASQGAVLHKAGFKEGLSPGAHPQGWNTAFNTPLGHFKYLNYSKVVTPLNRVTIHEKAAF